MGRRQSLKPKEKAMPMLHFYPMIMDAKAHRPSPMKARRRRRRRGAFSLSLVSDKIVNDLL